LLTGFDAPICQVMYLDRKIVDHGLLQAIARVNRTRKGKQRGYVVDYYGLANYLTDALKQFTTEDVQGALKDLKEEIPKLEKAHLQTLKFFKGKNLDNLDECVLALEKEDIRHEFEISFKKFAKLMDVVLPDPSAGKFLKDLKLLGKIAHGARNTYRDEQLNILDAGEKVKKLIEEHISATGVNPKIPPINLLDPKFEEQVKQGTNSKMRATEIKNAIRHHIHIKLDDDPAYYRKLSEKLEEIIQEHSDRWDELVQQLFKFRDEMRKEPTPPQGITSAELPFYNLYIETMASDSDEENSHELAKNFSTKIINFLNEASQIVDFFNKPDEVRRLKREIKNILIEMPHVNEELIKEVTDSFMDLAKHRFG
jgi:type I restriction enzyme R subunit